MKSKEELKRLFENGDIPKQEEFWEWQESYWHKDERLPVDSINYDFSTKADLVGGKVPASQLPSYIDDIVEFPDQASFPIIAEEGKLYFAINNKRLYRWSGSSYIDITQSDTPRLRDLIDKGNYVGPKKWISFVYDGDNENTTEGHRNGALGMKSETYSMFFGNMNPEHTGYYNLSYGFGGLPKVTSGAYNLAFGAFSGSETTTGSSNSFVGYSAGWKNVTGLENVFLGSGSGQSLTNGSRNTFLGTYAGVNHGKPTTSGAWGWNTFVGYNAGSTTHAMGTYGDNNVVIGANAPLGPESNMLVIHSMTSAGRHDQTQPFIKGSFADKWLRFDTSLQVLRLPQADPTFTQNLVAKPDGTFGWEEKAISDGIPLNGTEPGKPVSGKVEFSPNASIESGSAIMKMDDGYILLKSGITNSIAVSPNQVFIRQGSEKYINLSNELDKIIIGSTGSGVDGANYYGDSYEDNSFVQKKYIDQKSSYSNEEKLTGGNWIDGKPIYKKTVVFNSIPSNGIIGLTSDFQNMETIVSNQMFTEWHAMDVTFAGNQWRGQVFITLQPDMVKIEDIKNLGYNYSLIDSFTLTLEYTKTTD